MNSVTICNLALMAAGIPPITSFEDSNNNAKLCKSFYKILRDRVLRDHVWSFATEYHVLQKSAERSPNPEYEYVCHIPGDVIRIIRLADDTPYIRMGDKILTNQYPATLVYVKRVEDPNLYDELFVDALQNLLASEIVISVSRDIQMAQFFRNEYERKLATARSIDSAENVYAHQPVSGCGSFIASRLGYSGGKRGKMTFVQGNAGMQN